MWSIPLCPQTCPHLLHSHLARDARDAEEGRQRPEMIFLRPPLVFSLNVLRRNHPPRNHQPGGGGRGSREPLLWKQAGPVRGGRTTAGAARSGPLLPRPRTANLSFLPQCRSAARCSQLGSLGWGIALHYGALAHLRSLARRAHRRAHSGCGVLPRLLSTRGRPEGIGRMGIHGHAGVGPLELPAAPSLVAVPSPVRLSVTSADPT